MYCYCPKVKNDRLKMPLERPLWVWWLVLIAALISFKGKKKNIYLFTYMYLDLPPHHLKINMVMYYTYRLYLTHMLIEHYYCTAVGIHIA